MAVECLIDVRTWPERTDVLVVDPKQAVALAHFPLNPLCEGPLWDPEASFLERSQEAMNILLADQDYLKSSFHTDGQEVALMLDLSLRLLMEEVLAEASLDLPQTDFSKLGQLETKLLQMDKATLFRLLCDWHDVIERRYSAGSSLASTNGWASRAQPDNCYLYGYLATGDDQNLDWREGFELFCQLNDVDLADYGLGYLLRWVYFLRTEFADLDYRSPAVLSPLKD